MGQDVPHGVNLQNICYTPISLNAECLEPVIHMCDISSLCQRLKIVKLISCTYNIFQFHCFINLLLSIAALILLLHFYFLFVRK